MRQIDLNCDLGEGFGRWELGEDAALLATVTSANVACGFHAGDPATMLRTVAGASERGVAVGAHVSYRDLAGFGRRYLDASPEELTGDVLYQLGALAGMARAVGAAVRYVKPHGALYTTIASDERHARAVLDAVVRFDPQLVVVGLAGSVFLGWAREAGLTAVAEAFADRAYTPDGALVPRREPGALEAVDGTLVPVDAVSVCVHSDSPGAVAIARAVRAALEAAGVAVRPFVDDPAVPTTGPHTGPHTGAGTGAVA